MGDLFDPLAAGFRLDGDRNEAVVLLHGFTGVPAHFRPLAADLHGAGYTVVVPRLAGHGTSMEDMDRTGAEDWIESATAAYGEAVADHALVHLGGLSMGGLISILLAARLPVASVTTIDSPVVVRDPRTYVAPLFARWMPEIRWEEEDLDLDAEIEPYWLTYPGFPTRRLGDLNRIMARAVVAARRVAAPALVIQSRTDETVAPISARILANAFAGDTRLVWLERSMHNALLDRERDVISASVRSHLRDAVP